MEKKFIKKESRSFEKWQAYAKRVIVVVGILLIALGILMRATEVINKNYVFGFDHGREYLMVRDIVENKDLRLIGTQLGAGSAGIQGIFHGPGYYYFLAIPYILFSGDPYGGVVLMFVFGLGAIFLSFLIGKKSFGTIGGIILATFIALSPPIIAQSRFFWSPFPSTFFALIAFYFVYQIRKNYKYAFFASFFSAFVYHFEFAIAVPLLIALFFYSLVVLKINNIKHYGVMFLGAIIAALPAIIFEVRHNFMAIRGAFSYVASPVRDSHAPSFLQNQIDHFGAFILNFSDTFPNRELFPPLFLFVLISVPLFIYIAKEKDKSIRQFVIYLLILTAITFVSFMPLRNAVYQYYLFHLVVVYSFFCTYILVKSFKKDKAIFAIFSVVMLLYIITSVPKFIQTFKYDIDDYGGIAKIEGKVDAIDYIFADAKGEKFGLLVFSPPVYTYPYDYIILWRQNRYNYFPHQSKKGVFYLLIEKDPDKPWSYKGWLETVIKSGRVIKEVTLPSGFIIQKRIEE